MPGRANRNWCRFVGILTLVALWEMRSSSVRWKGKRNACWLCKSVAQKRGRIRRNTRAHFPSANRRLSKNCTDDRFRWGYFRPSPYLRPLISHGLHADRAKAIDARNGTRIEDGRDVLQICTRTCISSYLLASGGPSDSASQASLHQPGNVPERES